MYFVNEEGEIYHATIISSVDNEMIYYAGNSSRRFDYSLLKSLKNNSVLIVKMNDVIVKNDDNCI